MSQLQQGRRCHRPCDLPPSEWPKIDDVLDCEGDKECRPEDRSGTANEAEGGRQAYDLEKENARLRRAISELALDKLILQEAARGNF